MTLYEISTTDGKVVKDAVTADEAAKYLKRTKGSLYGAAAEGRVVCGRYRIGAVDTVLSRKSDYELLLEFDHIRKRFIR